MPHRRRLSGAAAAAFFLALGCCCSGSELTVTLSDGVEMPKMAFAAQVWDAETCRSATTEALKAGFRFIWSSVLVHEDCQRAQGEAIRASGVPREDIFIAGTVNSRGCVHYDACFFETLNGANAQYDVLDFVTLDMLMLDYPASTCDGIQGQWDALMTFLPFAVRTLSVSNFSPDQILCIESSRMPTVNQLKYSVGYGETTLVADNGNFGIFVQAYSPLNGGNLVNDELLMFIGSAHDKSAAQVALKWILQTNATVATQSTKPEHLQEDMDIFDFTLTEEEMFLLTHYHPTASAIHSEPAASAI